MPTIAGLPRLSLSDVQELMEYSIEYFEIPSFQIVQQSLQVASRDILTASKSSYAFIYLTSRPIIILLTLLSRYILSFLKVISQHTFYHGIIAAKEAWRQLCYGTKWFIAYQKSLPPAALWMEAGIIVLLIGLYLLRRYIRKKRYVERIQAWYRAKKNIVVMKYERFVHQVAQTSMVLALLLPHVIYVMGMMVAKWFLPHVVDYFANRTIAADLVSFYIPLVRSMLAIHKWRSFGFEVSVGSMHDKGRGDDEHDTQKKKNDNALDKGTGDSTNSGKGKSGFMSMFRRKKVSEEYERAAARTQSQSTREVPTSNANTKAGTKKTAIPATITRTRLTEEQKQVGQEISQLLQYWIVYFLLFAVVKTFVLIPVVGRILSNMNKSTSAGAYSATSSSWGRSSKKISWLEKIKPSTEFFNQCKLFFFVWLKLLPTSLTRGAVSSSSSSSSGNDSSKANVKGRIAAFEKNEIGRRKRTAAVQVPFSNRPIDMLYERLSPALMALEASTSHLIDNVGKDDMTEKPSFVIRGVNWCRTFLDVMVWTKLISEKFQRRIIATLMECTDLLPAMVTFLMPSYFTNYGIIYIQYIVPSAHSVNSRNVLESSRAKSSSNTELVTMIARAVRYLQYWVIQCFLASILSSFAPVLAWVPLSTHLIFLVWAYVQLESTSNYLYDVIEWELVAFGILKSYEKMEQNGMMKGGESPTVDLNNTVTMRLLKRIADKVPSAASSGDIDQEKQSEDESQKEAAQSDNAADEGVDEKESERRVVKSNAKDEEVNSKGSSDKKADNEKADDNENIPSSLKVSNILEAGDGKVDGHDKSNTIASDVRTHDEKDSPKNDGDSDSYIHIGEGEDEVDIAK